MDEWMARSQKCLMESSGSVSFHLLKNYFIIYLSLYPTSLTPSLTIKTFSSGFKHINQTHLKKKEKGIKRERKKEGRRKERKKEKERTYLNSTPPSISCPMAFFFTANCLERIVHICDLYYRRFFLSTHVTVLAKVTKST